MKNLMIISAITAFGLLPSCKHEQPALPVNIISLVDYSNSRDSSIIFWYENILRNHVLGKMNSKDRLEVLPIDFNSETSSQEIFMVDFSKNDYSNEYAGLQKDDIERQNHMDSVRSAMQQFDVSFETARRTRNKLNGGTDIFGALKQSKKYFFPGYRNIVVVFSDMLEYTDKDIWNFEAHLNDTGEIKRYLSQAENIYLQDMRIIVITGAQDNMRPKKFNAVKMFWEKYFLQCHDSLIDYSSGAVIKLEQILSK